MQQIIVPPKNYIFFDITSLAKCSKERSYVASASLGKQHAGSSRWERW